MAKTLYDPKCEELARYFLGDEARDGLVNALAGEIQLLVEDWLANEKAAIEAAMQSRVIPGFLTKAT